jgi:putative nucleotidyltransferase with HDIG domain
LAPRPENEDEVKQGRQVVDQLSVALTNARLVENLDKLAKGTVEALARTVDAKSRWTAGHSERVAAFAGRIARAMGLPEKEIETLVRAGLLHDIGKIGISLAILDKPDRLSDAEFAEIRTHPVIGAKILEPIAAYQDILPVVAQHHEKFNGSGYPGGLKEEEIDLRARIMAVADVWDALVSDRPYRGGWVKERAKSFIVDKAGVDFDPNVVAVFLELVADEMG